MKTMKIFLTLLMLVLSFNLYSQEPVVGVDDPESLFVDDNPVLHRNKQAALHIMRELLQCNQSGLDGVVFFFTQVLKREPAKDCGELKTPITAVTADDDYVTVMYPRILPDPRNEGATYSTSWFDTWRFADGKADEHWDPAEIIVRQ